MRKGSRSFQAFEVSSEREIRTILDRIERILEARRLSPRTQHSRYLDTFDWRIHRAGGWLREDQNGSGVELHWSVNGHDPLLAHAPSSPEFAADLPAGPLRSGLEDLVEPRRLLTMAEIVRTSQSIELLDEEGKIVCRVRAVTSELTGSHIAPPTFKILIEGVRGYDDEFRTVDRFLRYQMRLPVSESREIDEVFERLDRSAGRNPSALNAKLSTEMTAGEAVRLVLASLCDVLAVNKDGLLQALDTEFLHDFRVAVRRTRAILSQVGDVLPRAVVDHYAREFRWLGSLTGPARDLDVFLLNLPEYRRWLTDRDAHALDALGHLLRKEREEAQEILREALLGERFERLLSNWRACLLEPPSSVDAAPPPSARLSVLQVTNPRTWKRFRKVQRLGRQITKETPSDQLHGVRIQCKKLRYMLELFRGLHPKKPVTACVKELKHLQNTLGEFNDAQVHGELLRALAQRIGQEEPASAPTIVAIGVLVSRLTERREKERNRFFGRFQQFDTEENHQRFRELFKAGKGSKS